MEKQSKMEVHFTEENKKIILKFYIITDDTINGEKSVLIKEKEFKNYEDIISWIAESRKRKNKFNKGGIEIGQPYKY